MKSKQDILDECKRIFAVLQDRSELLKEVFEDPENFDKELRILHGRYSKLELLIFDLENMENNDDT